MRATADTTRRGTKDLFKETMMGACEFMCTASGQSVQKAFNAAVEQAQYDYGHAGYTGTIAEKDCFVSIEVPEGEKPERFANQLLEDCDPRIDDKWGPAGAVQLEPPDKDGNAKYLFFGWASS